MPITLLGPTDRFPSVVALASELHTAPENGTFHIGYRAVPATEQLTRFRAAGLHTPDFTTDVHVALGWFRDDPTCVVLGRRQYHTQGRDIILLPAEAHIRMVQRWMKCDWWSKFVPSTEEWRIHVFHDRTIARGKKVWMASTPEGPHPLRARRLGYHMVHNVPPPSGIRPAARAAVASLNRLYGAVDILITSDGPVVLEVNSLPAMDNYTRAAYTRAIRRFVGVKKSENAEVMVS